MPGERIGVGIIGCGRIFDLHMLGYQGREDAEVLAVADIGEECRAERCEQFSIPRAYADYRELLEDPSIDMVEILTPHHLHHEMAMNAVKAGKHISLQKPPALNVADLDEMIKAADEAGVKLRVYENFVFYPPIVKAKELIEEGAIGTPLNIRMRSVGGSAEGGWDVPLEAWSWRVNEKTCGGGPFVFDDGYHKFSIALYLLGEVEKVYAWIDGTPLGEGLMVDAPAICIWKHKEDKRFGSIDFTWSYDMYIESDYYSADDRVEITGTQGIIWVTRGHGKMLDIPPVLLYREGELKGFEDLEADWGVSFRDSTRHFLDVLHGEGQPRLSGEEAKKVLQFALAAILSAREGREVRPDEVT